jgi:hypothetical protein
LDDANGIHSSAANDNVCGCRVTEVGTGTPYVWDSVTTPRWGNYDDAGATHQAKIIERMTVPLTAFFDVAGLPVTSATAPSLDVTGADTGILWPTGDTTTVMVVALPLPYGFDGTSPVSVRLKVSSGVTNAATFTVATHWDNGSVVNDTATDSAPSATPHVIAATIAASDIPDSATQVLLLLTPNAHAADATKLYEVRMDVGRKVVNGEPI